MTADRPFRQTGIARLRVIVSVTSTVDGVSRSTAGSGCSTKLRTGGGEPSGRPMSTSCCPAAVAIEQRHHPTVVLERSGTFVADDVGPLVLPDTSMAAEDLWTDFLPHRSERWFAVADGRGRVTWTHKGDGETSLLVIASRSTPLPYLAHLRREGIPYLLAGAGRVDLESAVTKIRTRPGAECLLPRQEEDSMAPSSGPGWSTNSISSPSPHWLAGWVRRRSWMVYPSNPARSPHDCGRSMSRSVLTAPCWPTTKSSGEVRGDETGTALPANSRRPLMPPIEHARRRTMRHDSYWRNQASWTGTWCQRPAR
jgi:hypothetical protein